ncbi:MAG: YgiQ family radical SAM protein [Thermoplasmata archaeon HGW-Thermoplasmata-1]|nr:MAG: YgiQ family radical SAM protein [Thermoplasmata archaeon HGW-Thermoplasmata-1]
MIAKSGSGFDVILVTAEYYEDHPFSPTGIIAKVLEAKGFSVGIIEKPVRDEDFCRLGAPRLCFGVTSGAVDSMVNNYTPLKKRRDEDDYSNVTRMPDRAIIVYCNGIKRNFRESVIVLGGIEASLRRFAHYDYWDNDVRRSILFDTRADILVYGNGEKQIVEIAKRLREGVSLLDVAGTCMKSRELPQGFTLLPSFADAKTEHASFCRMQAAFSNRKNLAQEYDNNYVLQFASPEYTPQDLDWVYSLDYSRKLRPNSLLKMAQFSVATHRGCIGNCSFCAIALHQGDKIISRLEESILSEIRRLTKHPDFKGYIDDLGGPSANMYGMDCDTRCEGDCRQCGKLDKSHARVTELLKRVRQVPGVKKVFVRSGIRYDLAMESEEYIREISEHHVSGTLKIAPEHFSQKVLKLMNKDNARFDEFVDLFNRLNEKKRQSLRYYFMICHPGDDEAEVRRLRKKADHLKNIEQFQLFTPTPMSVSTCMYWTGMNPVTLEKVDVVHDYNTKKRMKRTMLELIDGSRCGESGGKQPRAAPGRGRNGKGDGGRERSGERKAHGDKVKDCGRGMAAPSWKKGAEKRPRA